VTQKKKKNKEVDMEEIILGPKVNKKVTETLNLDKKTQLLKENLDILMLDHSRAKKFWDGELKIYLSDRIDKRILNKLLYIVSDDLCYGVAKLVYPCKINKFYAKENNLVDEELFNKWWPHKEVLYTYKIKSIKRFAKPFEVTVSDDKITHTAEGVSFELREDVKEEEVTFPESFTPMKYSQKFKDTSKLLDHLFEKTEKYVIEKMHGGIRVILMKFGEKVKILMGEQDITSNFPKIIENSKTLSSGDFILDGNIINNILYCYDCLYLNESIEELSWGERKSKLHSFQFTKNIKEVNSTIIENKKDAEIEIKLRNLTDGGIIIKRYNSKYSKNEKSVDWITVEQEEGGPTTSGTTGIDKVVGKKIKYKPKKKKKKEMSANNQRYFSKWSPTMAYYTGFITADSHIGIKENVIDIIVSTEDRSVIEGLAKQLGGVDIKSKKGGLLQLRWYSEETMKDLKRLGIAGDKEKRKISVPSQYTWDFIRGYFDGDGNVSKSEQKLQLDNGIASIQKWVFQKFKGIAGKDAHLYKYTKHWKVPQYKIVVLNDGAKKVHRKIYSRQPYLKRKTAKWLK